MKKQIFLRSLLSITLLLLMLVSCARQEVDPDQNQLSPSRESSIFRRSEVKYCRVTADSLEVKAGAGRSFPTIAVLQNNAEVRVMGEVDSWYVIRLDNNRIGCIEAAYTQPIVKDEGQPQQPQPAPIPEQPQQPNEPSNPQEPEEPDTPQHPAPPEEGRDNTQLSGLERQMINLVNQERRKNDLPVLASDAELTRVARIKAQDIVDNNYFSHYSPNYGSPFDMMDSFGIEYLAAGENLAANSSVKRAHSSLMGSSGHRQNILSPNFTHIGIGVKSSKRYGYIFVQMFISKPR